MGKIGEFHRKFKKTSNIETLVSRPFDDIVEFAKDFDDYRTPEKYSSKVVFDEVMYGTSRGVSASCEKLPNGKYKCVIGDNVFRFHPMGGFAVAEVEEVDVVDTLKKVDGDEITIQSGYNGTCVLEDVEYLGETEINSGVYRAKRVTCRRR